MEPTSFQPQSQAQQDSVSQPPLQTTQAQPAIPSEPVRVGFGYRVAATLLDGIIVAVIGGIIGAVVGMQVGLTLYSWITGIAGEASDPALAGALSGIGGFLTMMIAVSAFIGLFAFLNSLLDAMLGATLGKLALGLRIRNTDGSKAGAGKLWGRYLIKNIAYVGFILSIATQDEIYLRITSILGLIVAVGFLGTLSASRQALHDIVAKTAVYKNKA